MQKTQSKTHLQQNKLLPQNQSVFEAITHFQAIIPLDFGLNPEAQLLFEASNTTQ